MPGKTSDTKKVYHRTQQIAVNLWRCIACELEFGSEDDADAHEIGANG